MTRLEPSGASPEVGELSYSPDDYAFSTDPRPPAFTAAMVNEVSIEVGDDGVAKYVWGYCPHPGWKPRSLSPPSHVEVGLRIIGREFKPGVGFRLNRDRWDVFVDRGTGWVCIGDCEPRDSPAYRFAPGAVAVLRYGQLAALWLRPVRLP